MAKEKIELKNLLAHEEGPQLKSGCSKVYRTIKVLKDESGMGAEIDFSIRIKKFKCKNGCEHHNHLVCVVCGSYTHLDNTKLEELQDQLAKDNGFKPQKHNFQIYGICVNCQ